jgi:hypothetical protein
MLRVAPFAGLLSLLAACSVNLATPDLAQIHCSADSPQCPSGLVCRVAVERCLPETDSQSAPKLTGGSIVPTDARVGSKITATFSSDVGLYAPPKVVLDTPDRPAFTLVAQQGSAYTYEYVVSGTEPEGSVAVKVTLVSTSGLSADDLPVGAVKLDFTPPTIQSVTTLGPVLLTKSAVSSVGFVAGETLSADPILTIGARALVRDTSVSPPSYRYQYVADGSEPEGEATLQLTAADKAGNQIGPLTFHPFSFDFTPPAVRSASVHYLPGAANPLTSVTRATAGTTITVSLSSDEPLGAARSPVLSASNGVDTLVFALVGVTSGGADFSVTVPAGLSDGDYVPSLSWSDLAGNVGVAGFSPDLFIKTSLPTLLVDQANVTYLRSPWGNQTAEPPLPAGPFFELSPADPWSSATTLPSGTFTFADGQAVARVRAWADPLLAAARGEVSPDGAGAWPRTALTYLDSPSLYVTGLDDAGNESTPVAIQNAEWIATPAASLAGNPNRLVSSVSAPATLDLSAPDSIHRFDRLAEVNGQQTDGNALLQSAALSWEEVLPGNPLAGRLQFGFAYDTRRGVGVVFGGQATGDDTWEWDRTGWHLRVPPGASPSARNNLGLVYDSRLGKVVLWGGRENIGNAFKNDMWTWDGVRWTLVDQGATVPPARSQMAMTYDSTRGRIVLTGGLSSDPCDGNFGYCGDVWEWDGTTWTKAFPNGGSGPTPRLGATMTFDSVRGRSVMFGGYGAGTSPNDRDELWEWDGTSWQQQCTSAPCSTSPRPARRDFAASAFDPSHGEALFFGGDSSTVPSGTYLSDLWQWNGTRWQQRLPALRPSNREGSEMIYDSVVDRVILHGGAIQGTCSANCTDTWAWNGSSASWREAGSSPERPEGMLSAGMTYADQEKAVLLFGGADKITSDCAGVGAASNCSDFWAWTGYGWVRRPKPQAPLSSGRAAMSLVENPATGALLMLGGGDPSKACSGGSSTACRDLWSYSGGTWTLIDSGTGPGPIMYYATGFDSTDGSLVVFGGDQNGAVSNLTWRWNGSSWLQTATPAGLTARQGAAATWDVARGNLALFGGSNTSFDNDTWTRASSTWSQRFPSANPGARSFHTLAYDATASRTLLFGGFTVNAACGAGNTTCNDLWNWDGSQWTQLFPVGALPGRRENHSMAFDRDRSELILFGGGTGSGNQQYYETWRLPLPLTRRPDIEFSASLGAARIDAAQVQQVVVRAQAGGNGDDDAGASAPGATLRAWSSGGVGLPAGGWSSLAANAAPVGASAPQLPDQGASLIQWTSPSALEARDFIAGDTVHLQVQPVGHSPRQATRPEAEVALDYIELRVRYTAGP